MKSPAVLSLCRSTVLCWLLAATFCAVVAFQLFVSPPVGVSNNGDFGRLIGRFALGPPADAAQDEWNYLTLKYIYDPRHFWDSGLFSSELFFIYPGLALGRVLSEKVFDIRIMGALHASVYIAVFCLLLLLCRQLPGASRIVVPAAVLAIFTDALYVTYLNSFHVDVPALVAIPCAIVVALHMAFRPGESAGLFVLFCLAGVVAVLSKAQHAPLGLLLLAIAVRYALLFEQRNARVLALAVASSLAIAAAVGFFSAAAGLRQETTFDTIFSKILPASNAPLDDLEELGVPSDYKKYSGMWAYQQGNPMADPVLRPQVAPKMNQLKLARFWMHHPWRAAKTIYQDLSVWAPDIRSRGLGNYPRSAGYPPSTLSRSFGWWSGLRSWCFRVFPGYVLLLHALTLAAAVWLWFKFRGSTLARIAEIGVAVVLMAAISLAVASLADACETPRHLLLFHLFTDIAICFVIGFLCAGPSCLHSAREIP